MLFLPFLTPKSGIFVRHIATMVVVGGVATITGPRQSRPVDWAQHPFSDLQMRQRQRASSSPC
jgi:hypothetical protein